ncbi:ornithine cyclodeaminase [Erythrobacter sp. Dej080120_24]|uniref:ornithine cyclodeaminase family protein n=1 Tax=Erythrobacter sp. Dej080120_24 TaxID=3024837 RepID=UPI002921B9C8|nr:ornithine cyclodeaminase [Erythrobacter sp. Dej080120_24]
MRLISRSEVEANLGMAECIELMRAAMIATSQGRTTQNPRQYMPIAGSNGKMAMMPGTIDDPACFGIKLVCKYPRAAGDPLGTHVGMVMLFDSVEGVPLAMVEGSALTGIRTAAASGLATDLLARKDATRLAVIGTGEQARRHVAAMRAVRPIARIAVWGRNAAAAQAFARSLEDEHGLPVDAAATSAAAVAGADVICTATASATPVLCGADLAEGQHLNLVGAAIPTSAEVDDAAVARGRFFVDLRAAAMAAAGELLGAIERGKVGQDHIRGEIGEVAGGNVAGRQSERDITIYKSLGIAAQDLAAAHYLWQRAEERAIGSAFDLLR